MTDIYLHFMCAHYIALTQNFVDLSNVIDVYDSLCGNHPNGNPMPFLGSGCPEQLLALCIPRALELVRAKWPDETEVAGASSSRDQKTGTAIRVRFHIIRNART